MIFVLNIIFLRLVLLDHINKMIKVGNIKISKNGKFIRGVKYIQSVKTFLIIFLPALVFSCFSLPILSAFSLHYPVLIITILLLIISSVSLITTSVMDPGILPPPEL